ncbi:MAG: dTMP kinase [Verrucomicrobia bacterium]|nr:dTMP kinase [Verrucomicrobiota bacterium]
MSADIAFRVAGVFITFEGGEACGKSTQLRRLEQRLLEAGRRVVCVQDPGSTEIGLALRHLLLHHAGAQSMRSRTELLLFAASRAQLVDEIVLPSLQNGSIVLSDRFYDSTLAYQGYGRGLDCQFIRNLNQFVVQECQPDRTLLLDVDLETSRRRQLRRVRPVNRSDRIEGMSESFFGLVRKGYLEIAASEPDRIIVVDATQSADQVEEEIWRVVNGFFS